MPNVTDSPSEAASAAGCSYTELQRQSLEYLSKADLHASEEEALFEDDKKISELTNEMLGRDFAEVQKLQREQDTTPTTLKAEPPSKDDAELVECKANDWKFDWGKGLGVRFQKTVKKGAPDYEHYHKLSQEAKKEWRANWAKKNGRQPWRRRPRRRRGARSTRRWAR